MCVRFIHFSRDLTFYYVCALRLEGEGEEDFFFLLLMTELCAMSVCALSNKKKSLGRMLGELSQQ